MMGFWLMIIAGVLLFGKDAVLSGLLGLFWLAMAILIPFLLFVGISYGLHLIWVEVEPSIVKFFQRVNDLLTKFCDWRSR